MRDLTATITIPAAYRLTVSLPQTETVENGVRTVVARSMHPQFLLALAYDRDWRVESSSIATPFGPVRVETFLAPDFRFTHDSLAKVAARVYDVLGRRFGEPQAPTRYVAMVSNRAVGRGGFSVRMNNLVVGGSGRHAARGTMLGPSYVLAHEIAHGWTMNASGFAANMLQEGWATFAEGTMIGAVYGKEAERAFWERQRTGYMTGLDRAGFGGGFEGRQSILGNPDNGRIHYFKGSWVFRSLEHALGSATFDRGNPRLHRHSPPGGSGGPRRVHRVNVSCRRPRHGAVHPAVARREVHPGRRGAPRGHARDRLAGATGRRFRTATRHRAHDVAGHRRAATDPSAGAAPTR